MGAAYYRLETKLVQRSQGHSAVAAAAYNAGVKIADERTGEVHDYTRKQGVYGNEILAPDGCPDWVKNRSALWNAAEAAEKRKDARTARQFILSYTTVLTPEENIALTRQFLQEEFVSKNFVVDVAYHDFKGKNAHNPHAHVLLTTRAVNQDGFVSIKDRSINRKERLYELRQKWAEVQNRYLEAQGREERVDHRSYQERGIDRTPGIHEGTKVSAIRKKIERGERSETTWLIELNDEIQQLNLELTREKKALEELRAKEQDNRPLLSQNAVKQATGIAQNIIHAQDVTAKQDRQANDPTVQDRSPPTQDLVSTKNDRDKPYKRQPHEPYDPTWHAVKQQLEAFGGDGNVEVGIFDHQAGKMVNRTWHKEQILRFDPETRKSPIVGWLKAKNAEGCHIYVRPAPKANGDSQGVILLDDIDAITVEDLKAAGLQPALVVETSYRNRQAWIRIAPSSTREEATQAARLLVQEYGGDPGAASYQQYGRMAGFLNKKDKHQDERTGKYPWVTVIEHTGQSASQGQHLHQLAVKAAKKRQEEQEKIAQNHLKIRQEAREGELLKAQQEFAAFCLKSSQEGDLSKMDWAAISHLAKKGYSVEALEHALWCSPNLDERKKGHQQDYVTRTVTSVLSHPDVQQVLQRRENRRKEREDARATIEQWQQYKDRERDSHASSASTKQERMKQSGEAKRSASSDTGKQKAATVKAEDVTITSLGGLDEQQVAWLVQRTLDSPEARKQVRLARWALTQDTRRWKQVKAEYLKELARTIEVKGAQAYHPYTDAEIGIKLRMAGFSKQRIYDCLKDNSPFAVHLSEEAKTRYLFKAIAPIIDNPRINPKIAQFKQHRVSEAIALPDDQRDAFIKEKRLDKLNLSITPERWKEQLGHFNQKKNEERER